MSRVIVAYGTRPERLKLEQVSAALRAHGIEVDEWISGQSPDLIKMHAEWKHRWSSNGLTCGIAACMSEFALALSPAPDAVIVQGDTATAFACAQAAFLVGVPVAHVEAGMRTYSSEPWPEEAFRRQIAAVARWHFAPGFDEAINLMRETHGPQINDRNIYVVGNTIIDTLPREPFRVLVTLHRRENWGARIASALRTLTDFTNEHSLVDAIVVRHPNWTAHLGGDQIPAVSDRFRYSAPMEHTALLDEIRRSALVVTDSGGLQEECAHFGVRCLVLRTSTERVALERCGAVEIVDPDDASALRSRLDTAIAKRTCYGDGHASTRIAEILARQLLQRQSGG